MKRFAHFALLLQVFVLCPAFASDKPRGEIRVLLSFDNSGHQVRNIIRSKLAPSLLPQPALINTPEGEYLEEQLAALQPGRATLLWLDKQGNWYPSTNEPDPRVAHSPAHITGAENTRVGESSGAWLVSGPGSASRLIILLPRNTSLGLGFEQWNVFLE